MGSIIRQRSFEAQREEREPPIEYSLEREPWRALRSSLAVRFTSRRRGGWSADRLSEQAKAEIISGLEARSTIISSYSRIQSAVRDLVAEFSTSCGDRLSAYSADDNEVLIQAKRLTAADGPLSANREMWSDLLEPIGVAAEAVHLIVHGFVEVREERSGAILFRFRQWGRGQSLTSEELKAKAIALDFRAEDAASRLASAQP